jgi:transcriptional regulator with XRE-family HTH domain
VSLGERIKERRQVLKVTQKDLAQSVGMTPQHISAIEQDKWAPSVTLLPKLAEELGVTTDYLLSGKESLVTDTVPAIKADRSLTVKAKKLLIGLVEELHKLNESEK